MLGVKFGSVIKYYYSLEIRKKRMKIEFIFLLGTKRFRQVLWSSEMNKKVENRELHVMAQEKCLSTSFASLSRIRRCPVRVGTADMTFIMWQCLPKPFDLY